MGTEDNYSPNRVEHLFFPYYDFETFIEWPATEHLIAMNIKTIGIQKNGNLNDFDKIRLTDRSVSTKINELETNHS